MRQQRSNGHGRCAYFYSLLLLLLLFPTQVVSYYQTADPIAVHVSINGKQTATSSILFQNQLPKFGMKTSTRISLQQLRKGLETSTTSSSTSTSSKIKQIALTFEPDGLWGIPPVPIQRYNGNVLHKLHISFTYSMDGVIHSVSCKPTYERPREGDEWKTTTSTERTTPPPPPNPIKITYHWNAEPQVNTVAGQAVLYLLVAVMSGFVVGNACGSSSDDDSNQFSESAAVAAMEPPKWE